MNDAALAEHIVRMITKKIFVCGHCSLDSLEEISHSRNLLVMRNGRKLVTISRQS